MDAPNNNDVDHKIKGNGLDNRKSNLRNCTTSENMMNTRLYNTNTSGHKGITWNKKTENWMAYIRLNYKFINLGYYTNIDDAIKAREKAEDKYFGEFKYLA